MNTRETLAYARTAKNCRGSKSPTHLTGRVRAATWAFTSLSEAVVQVRGQGGVRQVPRNDHVLVSGNGGILNFHSTLILSRHPSG